MRPCCGEMRHISEVDVNDELAKRVSDGKMADVNGEGAEVSGEARK